MASKDPSEKKETPGAVRQAALAYSLPFTLIGPPVVCGGIGYLLDRWLHTLPAFTIGLGFVGLAVGLRDILKEAAKFDKKDGG
ncbi:MAG TPA: AtpZ/AtpI family protein [Verrucomicrobiae bacterium]|nr:AtpZ/AtpI family protein [Verrucomicrobiae bacterium]